jgi:hypothetical protein
MSLSSLRHDDLLEGVRRHLRPLPSAAVDDDLLVAQLARAIASTPVCRRSSTR